MVSPLTHLRDQSWAVAASPHQGRTSEAFLLSHEDQAPLFAKRVALQNPASGADPALREERILTSLAALAARGVCFNFVTVLLSGLSRDARHLELVLERGGENLGALGALPLVSLREVLFQVVYALSVAQREFRFVHYDLHAGNVLVEPVGPGRHCAIELRDGRVFYVRHTLAKVADFGLSCLEDAEGPVYNNRNAQRGAFDPAHDLHHFADYVSRVCIEDRLASANVTGMKQLKALKRAMHSAGCTPDSLLRHPFFDAMREPPSPQSRLWLRAQDRELRATSAASAEGEDGVRKSPRKRIKRT